MNALQMLNELREHSIVEISSHTDGQVKLRLIQTNVRVFTYYGTLEGCIARAWAGEPDDIR